MPSFPERLAAGLLEEGFQEGGSAGDFPAEDSLEVFLAGFRELLAEVSQRAAFPVVSPAEDSLAECLEVDSPAAAVVFPEGSAAAFLGAGFLGAESPAAAAGSPGG